MIDEERIQYYRQEIKILEAKIIQSTDENEIFQFDLQIAGLEDCIKYPKSTQKDRLLRIMGSKDGETKGSIQLK